MQAYTRLLHVVSVFSLLKFKHIPFDCMLSSSLVYYGFYSRSEAKDESILKGKCSYGLM